MGLGRWVRVRQRVAPAHLAAAASLAMVVAACSAGGSSPTPAPSAPGMPVASPTASVTASAASRTPVIVDVDMDSSDTMALPFLLRDPSLDVLAVTVVGTGLVHCNAGLQNANAILATLGVDGVPVTCGRDEPLAGTHAFPAEWREAADGAYGLALERRGVSMPAEDAPALIRSLAASTEPPITVLALGPLTNVAEALQADPELAGQIERIVAMAGAIDVSGNVALDEAYTQLRPAEWNVYADPAAADIVVRSGVPITLVPLDATNDVPIDAAFFAALEADHGAAPADIAYELLARRGVGVGEYLWDPLASVIAIDDSVATLETMKLRVETAEGPDSGRTVRADNGTPVRVATSADRAAFEQRFLAGLRLGPPRPHPFALAGTISVTFDGTTCADDAPDTLAAGDWAISVKSTFTGQAYVALVTFHEGAGWNDLLTHISTAQDPTAQPDFVDVAAGSFLDGPSSARLIAAITPGTYGLVCLYNMTATTGNAAAGSGPFTGGP
jgi:inosine-uridine nucleoside N-ribohydrolase